MKKLLALALLLTSCAHLDSKPSENIDSNQWLENVESADSLAWVKAQNEKTLMRLKADPRYAKLQSEITKILTAKDRIPYGSPRGGYVYNFWQDESHVRGLWRRSSLASYLRKKPRWESLLDVDDLAKKEQESWVFKGANCLPNSSRCLLSLSRGGKDADIVREFDVKTKSFVAGGFQLPEAKSDLTWLDFDHVYVGTNFGEGTLTESGYPRIIKLWTRGTPLESATSIFEGESKDVGVGVYVNATEKITIVMQEINFFNQYLYYINSENQAKLLLLPTDIQLIGVHKGQSIFQLRGSWTVGKQVYKQGSVISIPWIHLKDGDYQQSIHLVYEPTEDTSVEEANLSSKGLTLVILDNVKAKARYQEWNGSTWKYKPLHFPDNGSIYYVGGSEHEPVAFYSYQNFLQPSTLYAFDSSSVAKEIVPLQSLQEKFHASGLEVEQFQAISRDTTKIPYFVVRPKNQKGPLPTLQTGYGGFQISELPSYLNYIGKSWLEEGRVYVLANIRGGGEFGPAWHQAALKTNRQKAFDDFIAVSEDLIRRGITSPDKLAIQGGSNGGLLVGAVMMQRPELYAAVVCEVPLLDMLRYNQLLAGASWMAEYGDPAVDLERQALEKYSPYQNIQKNKTYPEAFIYTSTKDDRVHPGHARKMVAKLEAMGKPVLYYENMEGGHSAGADLEQKAQREALVFTYLLEKLEGMPKSLSQKP